MTTVQSLLLDYQPNYNSNISSQSNGVSNQLMFAQCGKTGDNEGNGKEKKRYPGYILIKSLATTVVEKVIMLVTVTDQLKPRSKRMQRHSGRLSRRNIPTSPQVEETRKNW